MFWVLRSTPAEPDESRVPVPLPRSFNVAPSLGLYCIQQLKAATFAKTVIELPFGPARCFSFLCTQETKIKADLLLFFLHSLLVFTVS